MVYSFGEILFSKKKKLEILRSFCHPPISQFLVVTTFLDIARRELKL